MKKQEQQQKVSPLAILAFALVVVAVLALAFVGRGKKTEDQVQTPVPTEQQASKPLPEAQTPPQSSEPDTQNATFRMPPYLSDPNSGMLQPIKDPATVLPAAQSSYVVAQNKPKLLAQMPCFCYCDRFGHGSLHDCFVTNHAESCDICMKEALHADQLDKQGMSPSEIRELIVAQYHPRAEEHEGHDH